MLILCGAIVKAPTSQIEGYPPSPLGFGSFGFERPDDFGIETSPLLFRLSLHQKID
jgi:hypothetical protein